MIETASQEVELQTNMKGFLFFWSGQIMSILGSSIIQFVLTWWITVETESPLLLSLAMFVGFVPTVILTPIAGVFVDRWNKKALIGTVDFLQAAVTVVLVFLFRADNLNGSKIVTVPILLIFLAARGIFQAFHQPAVMALTPIMVPRKHLGRINSLDFFFNSIVFLIGPIIAAFLFQLLPIHHLLWIDVATFLIAVIPLIFIKIPTIQKDVIKGEVAVEKKKSFFIELKEGFSFIKEKKGLLALLSAFTGANFFIMPLFTLINLFIYSTHAGGETNLAFVMAFNQAGTIAGSILFLLWKGFKKKVNGVVIGLFAMYIGFLILAFTPIGWFWFMGLGFLITGFALPMANISSQTIWQSIVPKDMLGRVMSVRIAIASFAGPIGMILSGLLANTIANIVSNHNSVFLADGIAIKYVFIGASIIGLIFLAISWFFTSMRHVEKNIVVEEEKVEDIGKTDDGLVESLELIEKDSPSTASSK
ncbi:MAG: MFS transporter [Asgard group archaeon]|nr:MFS transporter [Asgard group archaeon]